MNQKALAVFAIQMGLIAPSAAETTNCIGQSDYKECIYREEMPMVGKFFCIIDRIAGLQDNTKSGRQSFTRITSEESKFFIQIVRDNSLPCQAVGTQSYYINDPSCRTRYKLTAKTDLIAAPAYSMTAPQDFVAPRGQFTIAQGGNFWGYYRFKSHYVYEGKCEKID